MSNLLEETEENVGVDGPLVGFVQHYDGVLTQLRVDQALSQQHTVRHVFDDRLGTGAVLKTDGVTHLENTRKHSMDPEFKKKKKSPFKKHNFPKVDF